MADLLFELTQVHYAYAGKIPALCGIDLSVVKGQKVAIIGANGSGKSTMLTMLDGLIFPDSGRVKALGHNITEEQFNDIEFTRFFRSNVGFLFQNPDIQLFCPTVKEDIIFGPLQLGVDRAEIEKRLEKAITELKITHLLDRSPHQLSIGEKRKVALAGVMTIDPQVLLLDEPTAGLDPMTTRDIVDMLLTLNQAGKTIITATHDMHIVEEIADIVHVFGREKKITRTGKPFDILSDQAFLQEHNLAHIHRHRHDGQVHAHAHSHIDHH